MVKYFPKEGKELLDYPSEVEDLDRQKQMEKKHKIGWLRGKEIYESEMQ
jgi:hypothetical protein